MAIQSSATLTFLFTDIEGSTALLKRLGSKYPDVLERHRALVRAAIADNAGTERGTEGDSFFVTFDNPSAALAAALTAQRRLVVEPWPDGADVRVRMGIHLGEITLTASGPVGMAVHHAARIASAAHGGQIVLSDVVRLACTALPTDADVIPLGKFEVRDVGTVPIYQLVAPGLPSDFPPLRVPPEAPGNLPVEMTSFVGRSDLVDRLMTELAEHRLVTLIGVGGMGKTRLAIEAARALDSSFPDGCWLVELAPVAVDDAVPFAFASGLGVKAALENEVTADLVDKLRTKRLLVVVDNCEHVLGASADVVERIVAGCPGVVVLATSREPLLVSGERLMPLPSMPAGEAEDLFLARAAAEAPDLVLDFEQRAAVSELCRRLDGLPLAIELAASRVRTFTPIELVDLLDERFRLLVGGRRSRLERHQTMRGTLDWSYDLCSEVERTVFDALSVFPTAFELSAARRVAASDDVSSLDVADAVAHLVDRSLLQRATAADGTTRFRMLETMRAYGREHLQHSGIADDVRKRHAHCTADTLHGLAMRSLGPDEEAVAAKVDEYLADAAVALDWCIEHHEWELAIRIVVVGWIADRRDTDEMFGLLNDALAAAGAAHDLREEIQRADRRMRGVETIATSVERGLRAIRSGAPVPVDRLSWPPQLDFQYGGCSASEAEEVAASLDMYGSAPLVVQYFAYWSTIRSLISAGFVNETDALWSRFEAVVDELRSQQATDNLAYLRARAAGERHEWADAARWAMSITPPADTTRVKWFNLTVAWLALNFRALSEAPFRVASSDLVDPWIWFRQESHLVVLRQHGAVTSALALHRLGRDDLADRFVAWARRDAESSPMESFEEVLQLAGLPTAPVETIDTLDTLIDNLIAIAPQLGEPPRSRDATDHDH